MTLFAAFPSPGDKPGEGNYTYRLTVIAAVVALVAIASGTLVALVWHAGTGSSTPLVTAILGLIAPTIVTLLNLLVSERTRNVVENGLPTKVAETTTNHVEPVIEAAMLRGVQLTAEHAAKVAAATALDVSQQQREKGSPAGGAS